jgi:hypothetical protein
MPTRKRQGFVLPLPTLGETRLPGIPELAGGPPRARPRLQPPPRWLTPPPGWVNSLAEWVVFHYLTEGREGFSGRQNLRVVGPRQGPVRGLTFFYQVQVPNVGHFASEVTRVDFLLPGFGDAGYEALAIDPRNNWTHPNPTLDLFKRETLATQAGIQLIWVETDRLEGGDFQVIEDALAGQDQTSLALFGA